MATHFIYVSRKKQMAVNFEVALRKNVWGAKRETALSDIAEGDRVWFLHNISSLQSPAPSGFPRVKSLADFVPARLGRLVETIATSSTRPEDGRVWDDADYPYRFHFRVASDESDVELRDGDRFDASTLDKFRRAATTAGFAISPDGIATPSWTQPAGRVAAAPTDQEWFDVLRDGPQHDEVNFWTPTPWNLSGLAPGARFYFLLKSPIRKIGGYGHFVSYENLTIDDAWRRFGTANGVPSADELVRRARGYAERRSQSPPVDRQSVIGCVVLSSPEFYPDDAFIDPEEAGLPMAPTVVKHKYFDHDANATSAQPVPPQDFELVGDDESPHKLTTRKDRLGAGAFRDLLLSAYGGACCVTGETSAEVLEAAHIEPYVNADSNHVQNGLLLRIDIHRLFDAGLLTLDDDFTLRISPRLRSPAYQALNGHRLTLPLDPTARPSVVAIQAHRSAKRRR